MNQFEKYSEVGFMECQGLGGGLHYLTTKSNVLFNFNDLLDLLNINDKHLRRRWEKNISQCDIETGIPTDRDGRICQEAYILTDAVILILNLYGQDIIADINRKNSVDFLICDILDEVEKSDTWNPEKGTLSTQFALEAIKLNSRLCKGANDALIAILESNKHMETEYFHKPLFDVEDMMEVIGDFNEYVETVYKIMKDIQLSNPEYNIKSEYSLIIDDYPDEEIYMFPREEK